MKESFRAIIFDNNKLLTIYKQKSKNNKTLEFYVLPGGRIEENKTLEENVVIELKNQINAKIQILGYLGFYEDENTKQHFYHCKLLNDNIKLNNQNNNNDLKNESCKIKFVKPIDLNYIKISHKEFIQKALKKVYRTQ